MSGRISLAYLPAHATDVADGWMPLAGTFTLPELRDELAYWSGPRPSHGDMVRVITDRGETTKLYVFDADRSAFVDGPRGGRGERQGAPWLSLWAIGDAQRMLMRCDAMRASPYREHLVLAACEFARGAVRLAAGESFLSPEVLDGLDVTERWARGAASWEGMARGAKRAFDRLPSPTGAPVVVLTTYAAYDAIHCALNDDPPLSASDAAASALTLADRMEADFPRSAAAAKELRGSVQSAALRHVPLSVVLCAALGLRDPLPVASPKSNRRGRRR